MMRTCLLCASLFLAALGMAQKPNAELSKLSVLLGKWESHEESTGPDGKSTKFVLQGTNTWVLNGKFLQIKEEFEIPGVGKIENLILMGFDPKAKRYHAWWYTSNAPVPIEFEGDFDGKNFTLTTVGDTGRPPLRIRYDFLEDGHYKAVLEVKREDAWKLATEAEYKRTAKGD